MGMNLIETIRRLPEQSQLDIYRNAKASGDDQTASACELANPMVPLRHLSETPRSGKLVPHRTRDAAGRVITQYFGDARVWRDQFTAAPVSVVLTRPAGN